MESELILIGVSIVLIITGLISKEENATVKVEYKKASAIVFRNELRYSRNSPFKEPGKITFGNTEEAYYYPVVRFTTENGEWITQELSDGYQPALEQGTELEILYDPANPTSIVSNSEFKLTYLPYILMVLGFIGTIFGLSEYLEITTLISQYEVS
jgi:hypothetical protein